MNNGNLLMTKIAKSNRDFIKLREERIMEALSFKSGTIDNPTKTLVSRISNDTYSYFLKPGKETLRKSPNLHDMYPNVGNDTGSVTEKYTFEDIWEYLVKLSIINQITFKEVLVLLYRNCYFIDHSKNEKGEIRYLPSKDIDEYLGKLEFTISMGFRDKYKQEPIKLREFLHFIDLLGWNEDVKYHIVDSKPDFKTVKKNTGMVNTIKSVISVPLVVNNFLTNIFQNIKSVEKIDVRLILSSMQILSKSRGVFVLPNDELLKHLSPYLTD